MYTEYSESIQTPLPFPHVVTQQPYSKIDFFSSICTQYPPITSEKKKKVFLGRTRQAWHTCIWGISPIFLCRYSQALVGCTAIFRSLQRCLVRFKSRLWLVHSRTFTDFCQSHSCVVLAVCLGWLSCCKVNLWPSLRSWLLWTRSSLRIYLHFVPFSFPSTLTCIQFPATEQHLYSMMSFRPNSSFLVSSDQRILFLMFWEFFRYLLANSKGAVMCLLLRSGFHLATTIKAWLLECCGGSCLLEVSPISTEELWSSVRVAIWLSEGSKLCSF